jgi:hypothetical protein
MVGLTTVTSTIEPVLSIEDREYLIKLVSLMSEGKERDETIKKIIDLYMKPVSLNIDSGLYKAYV